MITERTLRDYAWCPKLLEEPEHRDKRFKLDRDDWMTPQIVEAIENKQDGKYVTIEEDFLGGHVLYNTEGGSGFWVIAGTEDGHILLRIDQILLDEEGHATFYRNQKYAYQSEEEEEFEDACRTILHQHLTHFLDPDTFTVISHRLDDTDISTDTMVSGDIRLAEQAVLRVFEVEQDIRSGNSKPERCPRCWWKECPYRKEPKLMTRPGRFGMAK